MIFIFMIKLKQLLEESGENDIDSAAQRAGYTIKNIYHGTSEKFTSFKPGQKNVEAEDTDGVIYATDSEDEAKFAGSPSTSRSIVMKLYGKMKNPLVIDAKGTKKERSFGNIGYKKVIQFAKSKGNDGVIIKNVIDFSNSPQTTYIFFSNKDVKMAGVTYDDSGNVIPLKFRFDSSKEDLRL